MSSIQEIQTWLMNNINQIMHNSNTIHKVSVSQLTECILVNFKGSYRFNINFLNRFTTFLLDYGLKIVEIYNQSQIVLDCDGNHKLEVVTTIRIEWVE